MKSPWNLPLSNQAVLEITGLFVVVILSLTMIVWFIWDEFWVPVAGVPALTFMNALALAFQIVLIVLAVMALRESKS